MTGHSSDGAQAETGGGPAPEPVDAGLVVRFLHRLRTVERCFDPREGTIAALCAEGSDGAARGPSRVLAIIDGGLAAAQPDLAGRIERYAAAHEAEIRLVAAPLIVPGGEAAKDGLGTVLNIAGAIDAGHICRQSFVLAVGGGAVLDAAGMAASLVHRGVRLIRVPSTTLAQDDAGVGVKNGVNWRGKKNLLGVFDPPWAVVNDPTLLHTLPDADWRAGFSEAVKVALLKDASCFEQIESTAPAIRARDMAAAVPVIDRSARLHLAHIITGGDPFERRSARPLDFGHWSAHRIEMLTRHAVRHGEAVAIGLALDCMYAVCAGMLAADVAERVTATLTALGLPVWHPVLEDADGLIEGVEEFREHLGGVLTLTMLTAIGCPVDIHAIDPGLLRAAAAACARHATGTRR